MNFFFPVRIGIAVCLLTLIYSFPGFAGITFDHHAVTTTGERPGVCLRFDSKIDLKRPVVPGDYVEIVPKGDYAVQTRDGAICITGLDWGQRYSVEVKQGLPSHNGQKAATLEENVSVTVEIPNAPEKVSFTGSGYVLMPSASAGAGTEDTILPLNSVNVDAVRLRFFRISDRNIISQINRGDFEQNLNGYSADYIGDEIGAEIWSGILDIENTLNEPVKTGIPLSEMIDLDEPGIFIITAEPNQSEEPRWNDRATRWIVISDLGLTSFTGVGGLTMFVSSLKNGQPVADVEVALMARNNRVLDSQQSDGAGRVDFDAGLLRGSGGNQPVAVMLYGKDGDFSVMRLDGPALDLADRDITGREAPGPLDGFLWSDRGIYRPGENIHLAGVLRDSEGHAVSGIPGLLSIYRPDGQEFRRLPVEPGPSGIFSSELDLEATVQTGAWQAMFHVDPDQKALATLDFLVEDFVPERLALDIEAPEVLRIGEVGTLDVSGRFLFGAPAANLALNADLTVMQDPTPFPDWSDYQFGLLTDEWFPERFELDAPVTDSEGLAKLAFEVPETGDTSHNLKAVIRTSLSEPGGRATTRQSTIQIRNDRPSIGLANPGRDGRVRSGGTVEVPLVALSGDGVRLTNYPLDWVLVREERHYDWYRRNGDWRYSVTTTSHDVESGRIIVENGTDTIAVAVDWGSYRLEVFDPSSGAASSVRFRAGWRAGAGLGNRPTDVLTTLDKDTYRAGDVARLYIDPPYEGTALITVLDDLVLQAFRISVPSQGANVEVPIQEEWAGPGVYVAVNLIRPPGPTNSNSPTVRFLPDRAIGTAWLALDRSDRELTVRIDAPDSIEPEQTVFIPVTVDGIKSGEKVQLTVAAVDEGIHSIVGDQVPDPYTHFFGKRAFSIDIHDLYHKVLDGRFDVLGTIRAGGDARARQGVGPTTKAYETVSLFSGIVETDSDGKALVPFDIPSFNGTLRLTAVAFSETRTGATSETFLVQSPLIAELSRPRFLAPGDVVDLTLELTNLKAPTGTYRANLSSSPELTVMNDGTGETHLDIGQQSSLPIQILAQKAGTAELSLNLSGPEGFSHNLELRLPVREGKPAETLSLSATLTPGDPLVLSDNIWQDLDPETLQISGFVSAGANLDLTRLLDGLDRYPYGCLEQTISRATPLLYVSDLSNYAGITQEVEQTNQRVQNAIWRLLDMQRPDGSFGLWSSAGRSEAWLTVYALDFLTRSRAAGFEVPTNKILRAVDWVQDRQINPSYQRDNNHVRTYAAYVMAREGFGKPGDIRYLQDSRIEELNALEAISLAAALYQAGEIERAARISVIDALPDRPYGRRDYGSRLRDGAMALTMMAESDVDQATINQLAKSLERQMDNRQWLSTQEMGWLTVAAKALLDRQDPVSLNLNGKVSTDNRRPVAFRPTTKDIENGYTLENLGTQPVFAKFSVTGIPQTPQTRVNHGYEISKTIFDMSGTEVAADQGFKQGERYIVYLEGQSQVKRDRQALLVDLLPAGFEIENARLRAGDSMEALSWLPDLSEAVHIEMRDDRFVAAIDLADQEEFTLAYIVQAVSRGEYTLPAPYIEDMFDPSRFGRGEVKRLSVEGKR